ncbi:unnamed protein product [Ascophyllum nodosum]
MGCCSTTREGAALASSSRFIAQTPFFLYKALISAYFLFWCVRWPFQYTAIYLFVTYWAWYMGALYFFLSTVTALVNLERGPLRNPVTEDLSQPWQEREEGVLTLSEAQQKVSTCEQFLFAAQTFSGNISCVSSLVVAAVFWSSLYVGGPVSSVDINAHSFFACIMLVDQFIVATPRRLREMWISMLFATMYLLFDFIWYMEAPTGQKVIYIILDWERNLDEALLYSFGTLLVLIPIFTLVHYGIFRYHVWTTNKRSRSHLRTWFCFLCTSIPLPFKSSSAPNPNMLSYYVRAYSFTPYS